MMMSSSSSSFMHTLWDPGPELAMIKANHVVDPRLCCPRPPMIWFFDVMHRSHVWKKRTGWFQDDVLSILFLPLICFDADNMRPGLIQLIEKKYLMHAFPNTNVDMRMCRVGVEVVSGREVAR